MIYSLYLAMRQPAQAASTPRTYNTSAVRAPLAEKKKLELEVCEKFSVTDDSSDQKRAHKTNGIIFKNVSPP